MKLTVKIGDRFILPAIPEDGIPAQTVTIEDGDEMFIYRDEADGEIGEIHIDELSEATKL